MAMTPPARGGRAMPVRPSIPRPKAPRIKAVDPNQAATQNAMSAFRTALAQLKASTPPVDANAIRAPYQAASDATGQLGQGLQQAVLGSGQAAQAQYGQGLDQAQSHAAQFGISAGAQPIALQNTGTQMLAAQTQAQAAAAPQAASAWQQLLERTSAAKVADANLQRQNSLTSAEQSLSGNIPTAIANEKTLGFQKKTEKFNEGLALSQLSAKEGQSLRDYLLGTTKIKQAGAIAKTKAELDAEKLRQKTANDASKLRVSQETLALKKRTAAATAAGLKGVAGAVKALSATTSSKGAYRGWDVQVQPVGSDGKPLGPAVTKHGPKKDWAPAGYRNVGGAKPSFDSNATPKTTGGATRATWDTQMRALLAQNPGQAAAVRALLGPRPKK